MDTLHNADFVTSEREGRDISVTVGELAKLDVASKSKIPSHLKMLNTLEERAFRRGILNCVVHSQRQAVRLYTEETRVILPRRDESTRKLIKYFFFGY